MAVFGLVGDPVDFSLSPLLYRHLFPALGISASYQAFSVVPDQLAPWFSQARQQGIGLIHITAPHKRRVVSLLDELTPEAHRAGAVNVVCSREGRLVGHLTDGLGLVAALKAEGWRPGRSGVVIFGTGGTAAAVASALALEGISPLHFVSRGPDSADKLLHHLRGCHPGIQFSAGTLDVSPTRLHLAGAQLVVDTRPPTAHVGQVSLGIGAVPAEATRCDVNYRPPLSPLMEGIDVPRGKCLDGIGMFVHQAALSMQWYLARFVDPHLVWSFLPGDVQRTRRCRSI